MCELRRFLLLASTARRQIRVPEDFPRFLKVQTRSLRIPYRSMKCISVLAFSVVLVLLVSVVFLDWSDTSHTGSERQKGPQAECSNSVELVIGQSNKEGV